MSRSEKLLHCSKIVAESATIVCSRNESITGSVPSLVSSYSVGSVDSEDSKCSGRVGSQKCLLRSRRYDNIFVIPYLYHDVGSRQWAWASGLDLKGRARARALWQVGH